MITGIERHALYIAAFLYTVVCLPPVKHALETSMTAQMLVQIPLLTVVGYLLRAAVPQRITSGIAGWNHRGITGLVLASFALMFWMLPRSMDAAVTDSVIDLAKFVSVPLLVGLPLGMSWPRMSFVVRGVLLSEVIAMLFRLGWLYMVSPVRFCNSYLLGDQQRLGECMIAIGAAILLWLIGKLLWGRFPSLET